MRRKNSKAQVEEETGSLRDSLEEIKTTPGRSMAALAGMAAAGAAGVAAAIHYVRKGASRTATFDVAPAGKDGWALLSDGSDEPVQTFSTKERAVRVGRAMATEAAPSELTIRNRDGAIQESHAYAAAEVRSRKSGPAH